MPSCTRIFLRSVDVHSSSEGFGTMRAWDFSCHLNRRQHRGAVTLIRRVVVSLRRVDREIPCSQLLLVCPQMLSLHANDVLQRVRVLVGFVCTLVLFAILCGHATLEGWENGAGRCLAASRPLFTARWCGAHCGVDSAM
ncbi:hypothetical protein TcCL_ESM05980 [Trypanosoma cruzi]|nr:hypothetical protein TcCL_ESM05980 [Trypanosoma cruzi]